MTEGSFVKVAVLKINKKAGLLSEISELPVAMEVMSSSSVHHSTNIKTYCIVHQTGPNRDECLCHLFVLFLYGKTVSTAFRF